LIRGEGHASGPDGRKIHRLSNIATAEDTMSAALRREPMSEFRTETDSLGDVRIPSGKFWGA
jgi:hypothetical protein